MTAVAAALEAEALDGVAGLAALRDEWSALCDRCPWTTPFQRPEWLLPWCRRFGPAEPWPLAVRREGRLVGLLPLFVWERPRDGGGSERAAALLGAGISDHLDLVAEPDTAVEVAAAVLARLAERPDLAAADLDELRPGSPLVEAPAPAGWTSATELQSACPVLALPATVEGLAEVLSTRQLTNLRAFRRRLEKQGEVRLERAEEAGCEGLLEALFRLHGERWRERGGEGVLADPAVRAFHREVVAGFAARGALLLLGLRLDADLVAVLYGLIERDGLFFYLHGFDPGHARWSPGVLIVGAAIEEAIGRGLAFCDFLRGREPYKYRWGAVDRWTVKRRLRRAGEMPLP